jgi:two-component system sensor histidine kinase PilS (NtrC family)
MSAYREAGRTAEELHGLLPVRLLVMTVLGLLLAWAHGTGALGIASGPALLVLAGTGALTLLRWRGVPLGIPLGRLIAFQVVLDLALETLLVTATGGTSSPLVMLYFLTVFSAGAFLPLRWGLLAAAGGTAAFAGVAWIAGDGSGAMEPGRVWSATATHGGALLALAALSAVLAARSRRSRERLVSAEDEIRRTHERTERVLENMPIGVVTASAEGVVTRANRAAREMLALRDLGSPDGRELAEVVGALSPALVDALEGILVTRRWAAREEVVLRDGSQERPIGVSIAPLIEEGGRLEGVVMTLTDLREIRHLEKRMRRSEQLAALGELAAGVAHEIRNPLASISGAAQVLRGEVPGDSQDAELMDLIVSESDRLNRIIDGVLDYTRDHSLSRNLHDLAGTAREVVRMVRHDKQLTLGKTLLAEFPAEQDFRAEVEEGGMKQVFYNLVRNALEAMGVGGILRITGENPGRGSIHIVFRDTGQGIPAHELENIFKPFHTSKPGGTGMGLSIASRIVEGNGGTIQVKSTPGMGTAVTIELPAPSPATVAASEPAPDQDVPAGDPAASASPESRGSSAEHVRPKREGGRRSPSRVGARD